MERMRAELVVSRLLFALLLILASTTVWSYNDIRIADVTLNDRLIPSADNAEVTPWASKNKLLVASKGPYPRADLSLHKTVNHKTPWVGDVVTFTITITNTGPDGADYTFKDIVPSGFKKIAHISNGGKLYGNVITWKRQWIDAGESQHFTFRAKVKAPTGKVDEYKNIAQITKSNRPDPDSSPNNDDGDQSEDDEDFVIVVPKKKQADLSLHKNVNIHSPHVGESVTFTITINNAGPKGADYSFEDVVPSGYKNISHISNDGTLLGNVITWKRQWIDAGESQHFTFQAIVKAPDCSASDQYKNIAQITKSNRFDPDSSPNNDDGDQSEDDEDFARVQPNTNICNEVADLSLSKNVDDATPNIGDTVTFTINVSNAGPDTATNVGISDVVPSGYTNIANISNGGALNGNTITWSIASIANGANATVSFTADVLTPTGAANEYVNTAQVSASDQADPDSTPNNDDGDQSEDDEDNAVVNPGGAAGTADLMLTKSVNDATPNIGDTVTFTINVSNAGPDTATNVGISDVVPSGYTNIANISNGGALNGNTITWSIASIANGANATVSFYCRRAYTDRCCE